MVEKATRPPGRSRRRHSRSAVPRVHVQKTGRTGHRVERFIGISCQTRRVVLDELDVLYPEVGSRLVRLPEHALGHVDAYHAARCAGSCSSCERGETGARRGVEHDIARLDPAGKDHPFSADAMPVAPGILGGPEIE